MGDIMERPIIGIVARPDWNGDHVSSQVVYEYYRKAICECGGNPILILPPQLLDYNEVPLRETPPLTEEEQRMIRQVVSLCDGILMPGGDRIYYYDDYIYEYSLEQNMPILGTCMGLQIMVKHHMPQSLQKIESSINHKQWNIPYVHDVVVESDSMLYSIVGEEKIPVNSYHTYQVIDTNLRVSATAVDGVIEAVEIPEKDFVLGVQWHPEKIMQEPSSRKIIEAFIEACKRDK